jgi:hypothetical protein
MSNFLIRQRAEAQFKKLPDLEDSKAAKATEADKATKAAKVAETGKTALSEYEAGADVVTAKIAHLKGLRLARDAAAQTAPAKAVPAKKAGKKKKPSAGSGGISLSDWLKSRQVGGLNH